MTTPLEIKEALKIKVRRCYLADKTCSSRIADCHSIQNNKILSRISDKGMVVSIGVNFNTSSQMDVGLKENGRRVASIFNGLCSKHDEELFREIDQRDYLIGDRKQEFLFAFRALAKELWNKETSLARFEGVNVQSYENFKLGLKLGIQFLKKDFNKFKSWNNTGDYKKIETFCLSLPKEYLFAVSSFFTPAFDFQGRVINNFDDLNKSPKGIFLTIFPQNGKTYIIFSYLNYHKGAFLNFKKHLMLSNEEVLIRALNNIIIGYTDNFTINPKNWDSISKVDKEETINVLLNTGYYLPDKNFLVSKPVVNFFKD